MKWSDLKEEKRFRTAITILLAGLTVATSSIVVLNNRALGRAAEAGRDARILGLQSVSHLGTTLWDAESERRLAASWQELGSLILQMEAFKLGAGSADAKLYQIRRDRLAKLRSTMAEEGRISRPPYFDEKSGRFDTLRYQLDHVEGPAYELAERQDQMKAVGRFWGAKCEVYSTSLATMAVAVFLLTLAMVLGGRIRFIISGVGLALVLGIGAAVASTALRPWRGVSEESIRETGRQAARLSQANAYFSLAGAADEAEAQARQVQSAAQDVLRRDPNMVSAILLKSRADELIGHILFFRGRMEERRTELDKAAAGFEKAAAAGRDDGFLRWSLGFVELLRGRPRNALASLDQALKRLPEQGLPLGVTRALALLADGRGAAAGEALEAAVAWSQAHPIASDPQYYRTLVQSLERWNEVTPIEGLAEMTRRLKEAAVCVAYLDRTQPRATTAAISEPEFIDPAYDDGGEITGWTPTRSYPRSVARAPFFIDLTGMSRGQSIVSKVFWRIPGGFMWVEQAHLTKSQHWEGPPQARILGEVSPLFPEAGEFLFRGDYRLEIYVDGALKAVGGFQAL
jgi:tetratricopeptide (TPR) repeat protein